MTAKCIVCSWRGPWLRNEGRRCSGSWWDLSGGQCPHCFLLWGLRGGDVGGLPRFRGYITQGTGWWGIMLSNARSWGIWRKWYGAACMGLRIRHSLKLFQNKVSNNQPLGPHCLEGKLVLIIIDSKCSLPVRPRVTLPDLLVFLCFSALLSNPSSHVSASALTLTTSFPSLWSIKKIPTCLTPNQSVP